MTRAANKSQRSFILAVTCALVLAIAAASPAQPVQRHEVKLFSAADDAANVIGKLTDGEATTPLAETTTAGGEKWFLVRTKSGVTGWLRRGNYEQFKSAERFFRELPREHSSAGTQVTTRASSSQTGKKGSFVVPIRTNGAVVIVQAMLNSSVSADLILDTGASTTLISKELARQLALHESGIQMARTVNGIVTMPTSRVDSIRVGDAEVENLSVSIHDLAATGRIDGLLGLNFLNRFQFSIDLRNRRLILSPR